MGFQRQNQESNFHSLKFMCWGDLTNIVYRWFWDCWRLFFFVVKTYNGTFWGIFQGDNDSPSTLFAGPHPRGLLSFPKGEVWAGRPLNDLGELPEELGGVIQTIPQDNFAAASGGGWSEGKSASTSAKTMSKIAWDNDPLKRFVLKLFCPAYLILNTPGPYTYHCINLARNILTFTSFCTVTKLEKHLFHLNPSVTLL
jgi:hypothetical protein